MANFEEYRKPWETGPHWELKREFLEKYQDDYPLDRLLCLAQAYSNIELLHCSYPEPVMREVYQLSCQLKECNRFRKAEADLERKRKEKLEMKPRKAGKRSLSDENSTKSFKLIKFCTPKEVTNKPKCSDEYGINSNDCIQYNTKTSTNDIKVVDSKDLIQNSVVDVDDSSPKNNSNVIFSLSKSPDFNLIQKIAVAIPKRTGTALGSIESAIEVSDLKNAVKYDFVNENESAICCQFYIGKTLIATGRDATEKCAKERAVQYSMEVLSNLSHLPNKTLDDIKQEFENWKKATDSNVLWSEITSDLKSKQISSQLTEMKKNPTYSDLHFIIRIIQKLFDEKNIKNKGPATQKIQNAAVKLESAQHIHYFHFSEDPDTPLHSRAFHCDFVIRNIFICQSKASSKKKAKTDVSEQGLNLLTDFIKNCAFQKQINQCHAKSTEKNLESFKDFTMDIITEENINNSLPQESNNSSGGEYSSSKEDEFNKLVHKDSKTENSSKFTVPDNLSKICTNTTVSVNDYEVQSNSLKTKPKLFQINHRLLSNSRHQRLIVFDSSDNNCTNVPSTVLTATASKCKKKLQKEIEEIPANKARNSEKMFRCVFTLDDEKIGEAQGFTEKEAKSKASENALQFLQNNVYTIKVKNEIEESFQIRRSHVLNAEDPSTVLSESNIGCKMLKMMGWTGGGIGKTSGITEPIVANEHRFGQGLGFSNNKAQVRSFKQKIEALLKDYSQSNTTSDLIFSVEFSKEERKEIHQLATRYNLVNVSRGKGEKRHLFVGRKISPMELLERLIEVGGSTPKYELEDRSVSYYSEPVTHEAYQFSCQSKSFERFQEPERREEYLEMMSKTAFQR